MDDVDAFEIARRQFQSCDDLSDMEFGAEMQGSTLRVLVHKRNPDDQIVVSVCKFTDRSWNDENYDMRPLMRLAAVRVRELIDLQCARARIRELESQLIELRWQHSRLQDETRWCEGEVRFCGQLMQMRWRGEVFLSLSEPEPPSHLICIDGTPESNS